MSGLEPIIIYSAGTILLSMTAGKFLLREMISLVLLYKELKAAIKSDYPFNSGEVQVPAPVKRKPYRISSG